MILILVSRKILIILFGNSLNQESHVLLTIGEGNKTFTCSNYKSTVKGHYALHRNLPPGRDELLP